MRLLSCFTPRNSNSSPAHNDDRTKRSIEKAVEVGGSETLGSSPVNVSTCLKDAEKILVGRCLAGEQRAWEEVCQCYSGTIANVASLEKWRFDPHELEDVTQDIMLEIITALKNFEFKSDLRTFIYRIALNTCIGRLEKN